MADYIGSLHTTGVNVSTNELINRYTLNRNFGKLLENDHMLANLLDEVVKRSTTIKEYYPGIVYERGIYVWYRTIYNGRTQLFLLKNLIDNNSSEPKLEIDDNTISFTSSGWENMNQLKTLVENTLEPYIVSYVRNKLQSTHVYNKNYHRYGTLSDETELDEKVLRNDFSNVSPNRTRNFYPYETILLPKNDVVIDGWYRRWDNGMLEYDILYQLGVNGTTLVDGITYRNVRCNTLSIDDNATTGVDNSSYFFDTNSRTIFSNLDGSNISSFIDDTVQSNRNRIVNVYSSTIQFPIRFATLDYMIYSSDITQQKPVGTESTISSGKNTIIYTNKNYSSFTPVYVTMNDNASDSENTGLVSNAFHCHIVGRWK